LRSKTKNVVQNFTTEFLSGQMGFETEMRGIPEKYKKRGE
jgi:hypothetical protein